MVTAYEVWRKVINGDKNNMTFDDILNARNKYSYPAGHVQFTNGSNIDVTNLTFVPADNGECFKSSISLDNYHNQLLNSAIKEQIYLGICSVQYWGRCYSRGRVNHNQALVRTNWLLKGNAKSNKTMFDEEVGFKSVSNIIQLIEADQIGEAFWEVKKIPHLGVSFGSKLLAFINPNKIGIYDSHIARYLTNNILKVERLCSESIDIDIILGSPSSFRSSDKYQFENYCRLLQTLAKQLNLKGESYKWTDWDKSLHSWRAIDIERAFFVLAQS